MLGTFIRMLGRGCLARARAAAWRCYPLRRERAGRVIRGRLEALDLLTFTEVSKSCRRAAAVGGGRARAAAAQV